VLKKKLTKANNFSLPGPKVAGVVQVVIRRWPVQLFHHTVLHGGFFPFAFGKR
jgi:hypothetical protein